MSAEIFERYKSYRNDPWLFIKECVYTLDEVNKDEPIHSFPDKAYLELYARLWHKYPLLAVPKTRRMTMSWMTISLYVWDTIFHKGRFTAFVSKKEDDANYLVERAKFIVDNLDREKIPEELIPKYEVKFCVLNFPSIMSKIQGFPQGADQLRQFTFSGIFGDESAFWDNAEKFYSASFPTIDGGGRMTLVSSPAPGFFKKLCYDAMDQVGEINVAEYSPAYERPMQGVRVWTNVKNRFMIYELHYTADPTKRDPAYKESIKNSLPLQEYLREYELNWDTFQGQPVYPEFGKIHITDHAPHPAIGLPMLIGIDFGLTPAAVIGQFEDGILTIFEEITETNMGALRFMDKVATHIRLKYPTHSNLKKEWKCFADPAGQARAQSNETTCFQEVAKYFDPIPGPIAFEERRNAVTRFLMKLEKGVPTFQLYGKACPILLKGFEGGYRFDDKHLEKEPLKISPIKDLYSHCFPSGTMVLTPIGERPIETIKAGDTVVTPGGVSRVTATMNRDTESLLEIKLGSGKVLKCTPNHPIWVKNKFIRADEIAIGDDLVIGEPCARSIQLKIMAVFDFIANRMGTTRQTLNSAGNTCTVLSGRRSAAQFLKDFTFIIKTVIRETTGSLISKFSRRLFTPQGMALSEPLAILNPQESTWPKYAPRHQLGTSQRPEESGIENTQFASQKAFHWLNTYASNAVTNILPSLAQEKKDTANLIANQRLESFQASTTRTESALAVAKLLASIGTLKLDSVLSIAHLKTDKIRVYDLTVDTAHCFYANGVLVSNCHDATQYLCFGVRDAVKSASMQIPKPVYFPQGVMKHGQRII